jgi:hypothetical protein
MWQRHGRLKRRGKSLRRDQLPGCPAFALQGRHGDARQGLWMPCCLPIRMGSTALSSRLMRCSVACENLNSLSALRGGEAVSLAARGV